MGLLRVVLGLLFALLGMRLAQPQDFPLLAGHVVRTFYRGDSCSGGAFLETIEKIGSCNVRRDSAGRAVGSYALLLCTWPDYQQWATGGGDDAVAEPVVELTIEPTPEPTALPLPPPSPNPPRPSRRPTPRPSVLPVMTFPRQLSAQPLPLKNLTFLTVNLTYSTHDCSGDEVSTIAHIYDQDPARFLYSGSCRASSKGLGTFASGVVFTARFVQSNSFFFTYNISTTAHNVSAALPPPFSFRGLVNQYYTDSRACAGGASAALYQTVYAMGECLRGDQFGTDLANSSLSYIDNLDYYTERIFKDSTDCTGHSTLFRADSRQTCVTGMPTVYTESSMTFLNPITSTYVSSPDPTNLLALLAEYQVFWTARLYISSIGVCASVLMVVLILDLKKWTDFSRILLALSLMQLCFDIALLTSSKPYAVVLETRIARASSHGGSVDTESYKQFILVEFFKESAVIAVCYISNILSFTVCYIVFCERSFPLRQYALLLILLVAAPSFVPTSVLAQIRWSLQNKNENFDSKSDFARNQVVHAVKAVSMVFNAVCLVSIIIAGAIAAGSASNRERQSMVGTAKRKASMTSELTRRLIVYPIVQILTQFPVLWDYWTYFPKAYTMQLDGQHESDDSFYKQPDYRACWLLQFVLTPTAGLWFAVSYIYLSKDIQKRLLSRFQQLRDYLCPGMELCGCLDGGDETSRRSFFTTVLGSRLTEAGAPRPSDTIAAPSEPNNQAEDNTESPPPATDEDLTRLDEQELCDRLDAVVSKNDEDPSGDVEMFAAPSFNPLAVSTSGRYAGGEDWAQGGDRDSIPDRLSTMSRSSETDLGDYQQSRRLKRAFELSTTGTGAAVLKAPARDRERMSASEQRLTLS